MKSFSREVKQLSHAIADSLSSSGDQLGLVYVEEHERLPGLTRKRSGQNFVYLNADGVVVRDREIVTRIEALAIPPCLGQSLDLSGGQRPPAGDRIRRQGKEALPLSRSMAERKGCGQIRTSAGFWTGATSIAAAGKSGHARALAEKNTCDCDHYSTFGTVLDPCGQRRVCERK